MTCCEHGGIFVFGSNRGGRHGAGAALHARKEHGAEYGIGVGRTGNSYAIPTKGYNMLRQPLNLIGEYVWEFLQYAQQHPLERFFVTRIGCGLAGYNDSDIAPMFKDAPSNCQLPEGWR